MTEDVLESHRPALKKLALDIQGLRNELLAGFGSRREVLEWSQRLTVRTLGEIRTSWYLELGRQYRGVPSSGDERALMAALLTPAARSRELDSVAVDALRERLAAVLLGPAEHRALRRLRKDATEYVDETGDGDQSGHDPLKQRYIAMRPALDELDTYQKRVLTECVDGLEDRSQILEWGDDLELATHGELDDDFLERCYREPSTVTMLTSSREDQKRARELFAATYLIPAFNSGVRDLTGRAKEMPDAEKSTKEVHLA
ncbi:hypothetical protein OB955_25005 [Halobacteria archaeon AArc-m2/3/4]|uniref:Uncharacterized protein n=1 Tax=Natronoglomus mannanivorans TaxID=2979990 RepID=A0ABT2QLY9_9EURY|nr:hypothetical protein [Halobacteria archaeon AArc-m2/3/4]